MSSIFKFEPGFWSTHFWAHLFIQGRSGNTASERLAGFAVLPLAPEVLPGAAGAGPLHAARAAPASGSSVEASSERRVTNWLGMGKTSLMWRYGVFRGTVGV